MLWTTAFWLNAANIFMFYTAEWLKHALRSFLAKLASLYSRKTDDFPNGGSCSVFPLVID